MTRLKIAWLAAALVACAGGGETRKPTPEPTAATTAPAANAGTPSSRPDAGSPAAAAAPAVPAIPERETPDAAFRAEKPAQLPVQAQFDAPVPFDRKLANGARLLVRENHSLPLVAIDVLFGRGIDAEARGKAGLAGFVSSMLTEGTKKRTTTQLAQELEDEAISLSTGTGAESSRIHLNCLKESLGKALEIFADVLQNPAFRSGDLERVRGLKIAGLTQKLAIPGALASDEAARLLYGDQHPFGQPSGGTIETIRGITADDLRKFHDTWYRPNNALISVSGDVSVKEIEALLSKNLSKWKGGTLPKISLPPFPEMDKRTISALDKPATTQSHVRVVGHLFPANNPDRVPMLVGNEVLGGLFTSRLNLNLREKNGYSYGVGSSASLGRTFGTFIAAGDIIAQHTADAVREYEAELTRFAQGGVEDAELRKAQESLIRGLPSALETNDAVASAVASAVFNGLPLDYYRRVPELISKVTRDDVARVAKEWIRPDRFAVVIVGPVATSKDALTALALGPVEMRPAPGAMPGPEPRPAPPGSPGPTARTSALPDATTGKPEGASPPPGTPPTQPGTPAGTPPSGAPANQPTSPPVQGNAPAANQPSPATPPAQKQ
ncbi:MAG: M16 family metallopeptidase [Myxococcales bacterium]